MGKKYDRKILKDELIKRTQESDDRKEGEGLQKYFKDDADLTFVKFGPTKEEPHIMDIIPFIAGNNMPEFMKVKEGKPAYYLDIYVHQSIGPTKTWIVCPNKSYNEACPICEHINELEKEGKEWEDFAEIAPKRRCVYNIINLTTPKEEKKGIQIYESSHKYSEKLIQNAAKNPRGGGSVPFSHPDKDVGQSISFSVDSDKFRTVSGHRLVQRTEDISDEILENAHILDQIIVRLSYKEIERIFNRTPDDDSPKKDEEERGKEKDVDEDKIESRSGDREREKETKSKNKCPENANFGVDIDEIKACDSCEVYTKCAEESNRLEDERRAARADKTKSKINTRR